MIKSLYIKNFALIKREQISFSRGLNIIMGETGAGKSMIISALEILLGGRAISNLVRRGEKKAVIEAHFEFPELHPVFSFLDTNDYEPEGTEIIIRREFSAKGGSRSFLCDSPVNVNLLKEFGVLCVDFHGQHEHRSLLDKSEHGKYLDKFADPDMYYSDYRESYDRLSITVKKYKDLLAKEKSLREKIEFDRLRLEEIKKVDPKPGENKQLEADLNILQNAERINELAALLTGELYNEERSAYNKLHDAVDAVEELASFNKEFEQFRDELEKAMVSAKEVAAFAKDYAGSLDFNPAIIEEKRLRASKIRALEKKYGSLREIIKLKEKLESNINIVDNFELDKDELNKKITNLKRETGEKAGKLSQLRQTKAIEMSNIIVNKLTFLGIDNPRFEVKIARQPSDADNTKVTAEIDNNHFTCDERGIDDIEFYISTNLGNEPQPLKDIASGGEISRIMLSIKSLLAKNDDMPVLVFDEIDTGISGRIARKTGIAMKRLAADKQILSITHLPQIVALGDNNILVEKIEEAGDTFSSARILTSEEKIDQTAKLLGDGEITEANRKNAAELVNEAKM